MALNPTTGVAQITPPPITHRTTHLVYFYFSRILNILQLPIILILRSNQNIQLLIDLKYIIDEIGLFHAIKTKCEKSILQNLMVKLV